MVQTVRDALLRDKPYSFWTYNFQPSTYSPEAHAAATATLRDNMAYRGSNSRWSDIADRSKKILEETTALAGNGLNFFLNLIWKVLGLAGSLIGKLAGITGPANNQAAANQEAANRREQERQAAVEQQKKVDTARAQAKLVVGYLLADPGDQTQRRALVDMSDSTRTWVKALTEEQQNTLRDYGTESIARHLLGEEQISGVPLPTEVSAAKKAQAQEADVAKDAKPIAQEVPGTNVVALASNSDAMAERIAKLKAKMSDPGATAKQAEEKRYEQSPEEVEKVEAMLKASLGKSGVSEVTIEDLAASVAKPLPPLTPLVAATEEFEREQTGPRMR